jgi:hypothetical protein
VRALGTLLLYEMQCLNSDNSFGSASAGVQSCAYESVLLIENFYL